MIDLKSIKKTKGMKPPSMIVYGSAGVGKTTFAAIAPKSGKSTITIKVHEND